MPGHDSGIKCIWCSKPIQAITGEKLIRGFVMYLEGISTPEGYYHDSCLKEYQASLKDSANDKEP